MAEKIQMIRAEGKEMEFTRLFHAPRELVWKAYSEPEHIARWWGPKGCIADPCTVDFRPGGVWHYRLLFDGGESWGKSVYQEIVAPERIVYLDSFSDAEANSYPPEMRISLTFTDQGSTTLLHSHGTFASEEDLQKVMGMGVVDGIGTTMERLEEYLEQMAAVSR